MLQTRYQKEKRRQCVKIIIFRLFDTFSSKNQEARDVKKKKRRKKIGLIQLIERGKRQWNEVTYKHDKFRLLS